MLNHKPIVSKTRSIRLRPARWVKAVAPRLRINALRLCGMDRMRSNCSSSGIPICIDMPAFRRLIGKSDSSFITAGWSTET